MMYDLLNLRLNPCLDGFVAVVAHEGEGDLCGMLSGSGEHVIWRVSGTQC